MSTQQVGAQPQMTPEQLQQLLGQPGPTPEQLSAQANAAAQADLMSQMNAANQQPAADTAAFAQPEQQPQQGGGKGLKYAGGAAGLGLVGFIIYKLINRGKGGNAGAGEAADALGDGVSTVVKEAAGKIEALPKEIRKAVGKIIDDNKTDKNAKKVAKHFNGGEKPSKKLKEAIIKEVKNIRKQINNQPVGVRGDVLKSKATAARLSYVAENPKADLSNVASSSAVDKLIKNVSVKGGNVANRRVDSAFRKMDNALQSLLGRNKYAKHLTAKQERALLEADEALNGTRVDPNDITSTIDVPATGSAAERLTAATRIIRNAGLHKDGKSGLKHSLIG